MTMKMMSHPKSIFLAAVGVILFMSGSITCEELNLAEDTIANVTSTADPDANNSSSLNPSGIPVTETATKNTSDLTDLSSVRSDETTDAEYNRTDDHPILSDTDEDAITLGTESLQNRSNDENSSTFPSLNNHTTLISEVGIELRSSRPPWDLNETLSTLNTESTSSILNTESTSSTLNTESTSSIGFQPTEQQQVVANGSQRADEDSVSLPTSPSNSTEFSPNNSTVGEFNESLHNDTNEFRNVSNTTDLRRDGVVEETSLRPISQTPTIFSSFFTILPNWDNKGREAKEVTDREIFENTRNETPTTSVLSEKETLASTSQTNISVTQALNDDKQLASQQTPQHENQTVLSQGATSPNSESSSFITEDVGKEIHLSEEAQEAASTVSPLPVPKYIVVVLEKDCAGKSMFQNTFAVLNTHLLGVLSATGSDDTNLNTVGCSTFIHLNYSIEGVEDSAIDEAIQKLSANITLGEGFKVAKVFPNGEGYDTFRISSTVQPTMKAGDVHSNVLGHSEMIAYIIAGVSLGLLVFTIILCSCIRCICHKQTNSLDLCDIPHLNLKLEDYKLTPIPRPTITFPDYGRDLMISEGYNTPYPNHPPRLEDTILSQHHFNGDSHSSLSPALTQEVLSAYPQEMRTFGGKKSCSRVQSLDMKPNIRGGTNWISSSRERLNADFERKNSGVENPGFRKWF